MDSPLIFILFFKKENKIRKRNPIKITPISLKRLVFENLSLNPGDQVIYSEGTVKNLAPF